MKPCLLIITLALFFTSFKASKAFAQDDKWNYKLSAGKPIKIKRDTFIYRLIPNTYKPKQEKRDYAVIPVSFTNNTNDTLRYIGMSCSWWDIYRTDNSRITIAQPDVGCYKNGPTVINIAPHASTVVNLTILFPKEPGKNTSFRIGMVLQKYIDKQHVYLNAIQTNNMIWSNEGEVP